MEVVQWIARRPGDRELAVCFAPAGAASVPGPVDWPVLRRRGPTVSCAFLPRPLVAAVVVDGGDDLGNDERAVRARAAGLTLRVTLGVEGDVADQAAGDGVRFAAVFGEFVGVVTAVADAAGLPFVAAHPATRGSALDVIVGAIDVGRARLGDQLILFAAGVRTAALARGFEASVALRGVDDERTIDGRIEDFL